ncbi:MAG: hypothetical protein KY455_00095 [Euryarchaeota archaeon]|nr:hypothetical protein [Euryarchaeota archaeon]
MDPAVAADRPAVGAGEDVPSTAPAESARKPKRFLGRGKQKAFKPAPRVPAPLVAARPPMDFVPEAGMLVDSRAAKRARKHRKKDKFVEGAAEEERVRDEDRTPAAVYWIILLVSFASMVVGFLFWNSSSIEDVYRFGFLIEMVFFAIIILIVSTRLARKQEWDEKARSGVSGGAMGLVRVLARFGLFLKRLAYGLTIGLVKRVVRMVHDAKEGAVRSAQRASEGVKRSGSSFKDGFKSDAKPNFIVRFIHWNIRLVTRLVMFVIRTVIGVLRLVAWAWRTVVRIGWALYQGIVLPVLLLAWRIGRGVLRLAYRLGRWSLKVVWRTTYWVLRRWPIKYATNLAKEPVQRGIEPRVLLTNVVVSDFLAAPVKPEVREKAEPYVVEWRVRRETALVARLYDKKEDHERLAQEYLVIPSPEERRAMREERKRHKLERKEEAKRLELEAKEAKKQAKLDAKQARLDAKAADKEMSAEEREALNEEAKRRKEEEKARRQAENERLAAMSDADKKAYLEAQKAEKRAAKEAAKAEKKASKEAEKESAPETPPVAAEVAEVTEKTPGERFKERIQVKEPGQAEAEPAEEVAESAPTAVQAKTKRAKKPSIRAKQKELGRRLTPAEKKAFKRRRKLEKIQAKAREAREKKEAKAAEKQAKKDEKAALKEAKAAEKAEKQKAKADEKAADLGVDEEGLVARAKSD